ncbi:hypothetical protein K458DRAFT_407583 [Lentithecium fluviatile CBS 122367]|uniref:Uncharacterized protein n=1 Tax=Lentithecium fluviatile CBS 122367 TaxID=1168545 RepID=A0A6G1IPT3_9PLEO|nr:hypothetical protein K458DRAFT_407583 [Lentithecium fluviatile CBS 122367]
MPITIKMQFINFLTALFMAISLTMASPAPPPNCGPVMQDIWHRSMTLKINECTGLWNPKWMVPDSDCYCNLYPGVPSAAEGCNGDPWMEPTPSANFTFNGKAFHITGNPRSSRVRMHLVTPPGIILNRRWQAKWAAGRCGVAISLHSSDDHILGVIGELAFED